MITGTSNTGGRGGVNDDRSAPNEEVSLSHAEGFIAECQISVIRLFKSFSKSSNSRDMQEAASFPIPYWYETNFWEPSVLLALRDLCRPGNTVFDVGANAGALTVPMSRLVGPRGVVCAFEASPRIIDKCQHNLVVNGCGNVQLFHRAVFRSSNELLRIYFGATLNDTIMPDVVSYLDATGEYGEVKSIALDDFVAYTGLAPDLVKMDIEGAEFDAIQGMEKTLESAKPHLILEQQPSDMRCHEVLRKLGYYAIDLASLTSIENNCDFPPGTEIANVLFIHETRSDETLYRPTFTRDLELEFPASAFSTDDNGSWNLRQPLQLTAGRYLFEADFSAEGHDNEMMAGIESNGEMIFRYHSNTHFLSTSYRHWVIQLDESASINLFFRYLNETNDPTFSIRGIKVFRIGRFESESVPVVD